MENQLQQFDQLQADIQLYVKPVMTLKVSDSETQKSATASVKEIKSWSKKVEERRKELTAPLRARIEQINSLAEKISQPLLDAEKHCKVELISYDKVLEVERQKQLKAIEEERIKKEKEAAEAAKKAQEQAEAAAMFGSGANETRAALVANAEAERIKEEAAKEAKRVTKQVESNRVSGIREIWKYEILDSSKVPDEFWIVDDIAIGKAVRSGARQISGVRIYSEQTLGVR